MTSEERKRIRVLQFVECWLPQTETWLYNHVAALPEWVSSTVVCQWTQNLTQFPRERLLSLEKPPQPIRFSQRILRKLDLWDDRKRHLPMLERVFRDRKPEILHSHFGHFGWFNSRLARKYRVRHIVSFYGLDVAYLPAGDARWFTRYRRMSERVDLVLCEGPHMARCIADLGIEPKKIKVFRLGIDLSRIPFVLRRKNSAGKLRFLIAGSFREKKGIPYAFEALGRFHTAHPDIEVTIIGDTGGSDREQREKQKILEQVQRWGLAGKMRFLGYQPHEVLIREFYQHDIFLSPSVTSSDGDTEGGAPVTIIEAAASGMPVVSTQHCDIPFVLSDKNGPYLVLERDARALERAIDKLTQLEDWGEIVLANRKLIEDELDVSKQARKLAEIYQLVANPSPAKEQGSARAAAQF